MKKIMGLLAVVISSLALAVPSQAQFSTPPPIPNVAYPAKTFTAAGNFIQPVNGVSSALIEVSGTYSALNMNIQCTNNSTYFNLPLTFATGGPVTTVITGASTAANGDYYLPVTNCTNVKYLVNSITGTSVTVRMVANNAMLNFMLFNPLASQDPCLDRTIAKTNVVINITTATTTLLVDASSGKKVYPCNFQATVGASSSVAFEYGTKVSTDCDTGATAMTGAFTPATGGQVTASDLGPTPVSQQYCAVSTGTGGIKGVLTYVQQ